MNELSELDLLGLSELLRTRAISPFELLDETERAVSAADAHLNALVEPAFEMAKRQAALLDDDTLFGGVPIAIKDSSASVSGLRQSAGSRFLREHIATEDSLLVERYLRAGLVIVGTTNQPEFGASLATEPALYGPCRNPWRLDRTPGGSSGGSAALVAAGAVTVAHGADGGGSIRIPAAYTGCFGLKPTRGRMPGSSGVGLDLSTQHVITRTVRDSAAVLDATILRGGVRGPFGPLVARITSPPRRLRIAYSVRTPSGGSVDPWYVQAVERGVELLERSGHRLESLDTPVSGPELNAVLFPLYRDDLAATVDRWSHLAGRVPAADELEPHTWRLLEFGRSRSSIDHLRDVAELARVLHRADALLESFDLWMSPPAAVLPPLIGATPDPPVDRAAAVRDDYLPFTAFANASGRPAMSVPFGLTDDGLPLALHFTGRIGDEATLLQLAAQLERMEPWVEVEAARPTLPVGSRG